MKRSSILVAVALSAAMLTLTSLVIVISSAQAGASSSIGLGQSALTEYPVPGNPQHVEVESAGRIWFTLPDQDLIGHLAVTSTTAYEVTTYTIPTVDSEPYDLEYVAGMVWFTERTGNKIGRLNPASGAVDEFPVPTLDSQPVGIDVASGSPTRIWFVEQQGSKLGQLVVTSTAVYTFSEYALPVDKFPGDAQPQDVYYEGPDSIWFTAPGAERIGNFKPSYWSWSSNAFRHIPTGTDSEPWAILVDAGGYPWLTDYAGNRIGVFFPQTQSDIRWYDLPTADSGPYDLAYGQGFLWLTERDSNRVGRRTTARSAVIYETSVPGAQPRGLAVDENGNAWIAEWATERIAKWQPPYFYYVYLPLTTRSD